MEDTAPQTQLNTEILTLDDIAALTDRMIEQLLQYADTAAQLLQSLKEIDTEEARIERIKEDLEKIERIKATISE